MMPRISMITLGVRDLPRAIRFYEQGLGFPRMDSPPEVAFFTLNGTWLGLWASESLAEDAGVPPAGTGFNHFSLAHNVATREDVDRVLAQARDAGATITSPARETDWGGYAGSFADPEGHLWEVAHNPHFWVGPPDPA
jgi:hypothetical protein